MDWTPGKPVIDDQMESNTWIKQTLTLKWIITTFLICCKHFHPDIISAAKSFGILIFVCGWIRMHLVFLYLLHPPRLSWQSSYALKGFLVELTARTRSAAGVIWSATLSATNYKNQLEILGPTSTWRVVTLWVLGPLSRVLTSGAQAVWPMHSFR